MNDGAYYFGCWGDVGHYLRTPTGRTANERTLPEDFPVAVRALDGGLLPPRQSEIQGRATLAHINGWTLLSFWDRSVDKRGACNSTFLFRGRLDFQEAKEAAIREFPDVWRRFEFEVTEYEPPRSKSQARRHAAMREGVEEVGSG